MTAPTENDALEVAERWYQWDEAAAAAFAATLARQGWTIQRESTAAPVLGED